VVGTHNRKKGGELVELLRPLGITVQTLADFPQALEIDESGETFAENAALKATQQGIHLKNWVLGDDSGIVVDALDGRPGVYSARFAGPDATDAQNNERLLKELGKLEPARRTARFVCHLVLADPTGVIRAESIGSCEGRIIDGEAGNNGFGYDPLFEIVEYHRTFGQIGPAAKSCLSHRARAIQALIPKLERLLVGPP
jgi:XTP/dITP diphosphohydrolase